MSFIKGIYILSRKEIKDAFFSPLIYILSGLFCMIMGWLFFNYLLASSEHTTKTLADTVLIPLFGNMNFIFLFLAPLLCMRLFSEEKKNHTLDLLLGSDLSSMQIIFSKFISSFAMTLFMLFITLIFPLTLALSGYSDWSLVLGGYLGITFCVASYLSVSLFASSLTNNQVVAAILSFCFLLGMTMLVLTSNATHNYILAQIIQYLSVPSHFESFIYGPIKSYDIVFYFSFCGFFFYLTRLSLDSRNW